MRPPLRQEMLDDIIKIVALVRPIAEAVSRRDRDLSSQIRRAMSSVGLNIAEGFGTAAGNARLRFETARGSLYETQAGIRIAEAWGFVSLERRRCGALASLLAQSGVADARASDQLHELQRQLVGDELVVRKRGPGLVGAHTLPGAGAVTAARL